MSWIQCDANEYINLDFFDHLQVVRRKERYEIIGTHATKIISEYNAMQYLIWTFETQKEAQEYLDKIMHYKGAYTNKENIWK